MIPLIDFTFRLIGKTTGLDGYMVQSTEGT